MIARRVTLVVLWCVGIAGPLSRGQDCVGLFGFGPDGAVTYVSGFSCAALRATPILDIEKDEIPTSPAQAARIAENYLLTKHPMLVKDWFLDSVSLDHYDFPDGSRWYYAVKFLNVFKDIPRFRPKGLYIVVSSEGKPGFFKPKPGK